MSMRILFGLDHTLFDTHFFKQDVALSFFRFGIPEEEFWSTFHLSHNADLDHKGTYSIEKHMKLLGDAVEGLTADQIFAELARRASMRGSGYLYPDVLPSLQQLYEQGIELHVLSLGAPNEQRLKFMASGIAPYCKSFHTTNLAEPRAGKLRLANSILNRKGVSITVNGLIPEVAAFEHEYLELRHFLIRRYNESTQLGGPGIVVQNLFEVLSQLAAIPVR